MSEAKPQMADMVKKGFNNIAATYEQSFPEFKIFAEKSIAQAPPLTSESVVHDNACGPGTVSFVIISQL